MLRYNLRLPLPLGGWPDRLTFLQALSALGGRLLREFTTIPWVCVELPANVDPFLLPGVLEAETEQRQRPASFQPERLRLPWPQAIDPGFSWATFHVRANQVHPVSQGEGVHIAVLDTGVAAHAEFVGADLHPESVRGAEPTDTDGHGTAVLGVLAAQGVVILGIAPRAMYHVIQILDASGGTDADMAAGIERAGQIGVNLLSMSVGLDGNSPLVADALGMFVSSGRLAVIAAGNGAPGFPPGVSMMFPATLPTTLAVGATDIADALASFSLWGPWPNSPDCVGPGVNVGSTWLDQAYVSASGTSLAAPVVAGCLALSLAANPDAWAVSGVSLDPKYGVALPAGTVRARQLLRDHSVPLGIPRDQVGYGRIDALRLAQAASPPLEPSPTPRRLWLPVALGVAGVAAVLLLPRLAQGSRMLKARR